jgi:hypothetical protein
MKNHMLALLLMGLLALGFNLTACGDDEEDGGGGNNGGNNANNNADAGNNADNNDAGNNNADVPTNNANNDAGNNVEDPLCQEYCDGLFAACSGSNAQYDSPSECLEVCATLRRDGQDGDVEGDTIQCRIYHAGVAATTDPGFHCAHAGQTGAGVCVDAPAPPCDVYCGLMLEGCQGTFANVDACRTACAEYPDTGAIGDRMGNSVQCRLLYATLASSPDTSDADQATYCANADPIGNGICGLPQGQIDRMGRPAINTALIPSARKDEFNQAGPGDGAGFVADVVASLTAIDGLDGDNTTGLLADNREGLANLLLADFLTVDISQDNCDGGYLALELGVAANCGGRTLEQDVIDVTLQALVGNPGVTDAVDATEAPFSNDFPYLAAPGN